MGAWRRVILFVGLILALVLIPGFPPYTSFKSIELAPTQTRDGILAPNNALDNAKRLKIDELIGPEAYQVHNGALYTTLGTGEVVKLSAGGHATFVTKIGLPCEGIWQEHKCGRPLGFRIDAAGKYIYVADAYYGIWKVELATDKKQLLVPPNVEIEGVVPKLFNSVALAKNGDLYWTDSSADFHLKDGSFASLADPSGRLFHYNAARNQSRVLINGLWFANGLALSPDEDFVIVSETLASRVQRIFLKGPKKGQKDIFLDGLPGVVDNIQPLPDNSGVLISLYRVFSEESPLISRTLARFPLLRRFLARVQRLAEIPFEYVNQHFPNTLCEKVVYHIGHFSSLAPMLPQEAGIIQVDWDGKIVGAWFSQDGSTGSISDAIVYHDNLYIGSPHNPFLAVVPAPERLKLAFKTNTGKRNEQPRPIEEPVAKKTAEPAKEVPKPVVTKPVTEKPPAEKPATAKPIIAKPTAAKPADAKPVTEKPAAAKPVPEKPVAAKPVTEKPASAKSDTVKPAAAKPVTEKPASAKPDTVKPAVAKPVTEKPTAAKPVTDKPAAAKPVDVKHKSEPLEKQHKKDSSQTAQQKQNDDKKKPEQIPITEEIKVDTARPAKEPLKVIKRDGPAEIPHPEL